MNCWRGQSQRARENHSWDKWLRRRYPQPGETPDFPNTIAGVIYQPWAITAVHDGQFWLTPNQSAYNAAQQAINGVDPTYGAVFYYNPVTATNLWIRTRPIITKIGNHVFAR